MAEAPLIAHIIHRLDVGGLENGLVNLINRIPAERYRHAIICMTEYADFHRRLTNPAVSLHALHKREGKDPGAYFRLWRLLRRLRPTIVHSRNLSAQEGAVIAALAGVPWRVHGEHGRDIHDLDGKTRKYLWLRRFCQPFVHRYIPLSQDLERWLHETVGVPSTKIVQLYNGVDSKRFHPPMAGRGVLPRSGFVPQHGIVIGTVGRLEQVKDQLTLVRAFAELLRLAPAWADLVRLVLVGDGSTRMRLETETAALGVADKVWITGNRDDVPAMMAAMDIFVLPSVSEGISNTILEAMATGLPVIATRVGGNPELIQEGTTGLLVPPSDPLAMAKAILEYLEAPQLMLQHGEAGRQRVETMFSMQAMVARYLEIYDQLSGAMPQSHITEVVK